MGKSTTFKIMFDCRACGAKSPLTRIVFESQMLYCEDCSNAIGEWIAIEGYTPAEAIEHVRALARDSKRGESLRP